MKPIKDILDYPLLTEKSMSIRPNGNQYVFKVKTAATKIQIKQAIELRFSVKVLSVNTLNAYAKIKVLRGKSGRRSNWKKAYVRLQDGDVIKELE